MTDTMRKRLEQAVCKAATEGFLDDEPGCYAVGIGMPGRCGACLLMVDAILSVLERPTRGMYQAAFDEMVPAADAEACWRAMIAAIREGKS